MRIVVDSSEQTLTEVTRTAENLREVIRKRQISFDEGALILVEQEPSIQEMYVEVLKPLGLKCVCVERGDFVYAELIKTKCKLMIIDPLLPGIDGLELIKTIRETFDLDFPILILTNVILERFVNEAYLVGADDYLVKTDIVADDLRNSVKILLRKSYRSLAINTLSS